MTKQELEQRATERAKAEHIRIIALAGTNGTQFISMSQSAEPGAYWQLSVDADGHTSCNCPGYQYRHSCKHVAALERRLQRAGRKVSQAAPSKGMQELRRYFGL